MSESFASLPTYEVSAGPAHFSSTIEMTFASPGYGPSSRLKTEYASPSWGWVQGTMLTEKEAWPPSLSSYSFRSSSVLKQSPMRMSLTLLEPESVTWPLVSRFGAGSSSAPEMPRTSMIA